MNGDALKQKDFLFFHQIKTFGLMHIQRREKMHDICRQVLFEGARSPLCFFFFGFLVRVDMTVKMHDVVACIGNHLRVCFK